MAKPPKIDVFVGREIDNATERRLLRRLLSHFEQQGVDAVVMANLTLGHDHRQIDFIVATTNTAAVIEAKGYVYPVQGGLNGSWRLQLGERREKPLGKTNPYYQALDARYAVADAIAAHAGLGSDEAKAAVKGALCLFPSPVEGSKIPASDFKLTLGGVAELEALLATPLLKPLSLATWRGFAAAIGARDDSHPFPTADDTIADEYIAAFLSLRRAVTGPYVEPAFVQAEVSTGSLAQRLRDGAQLHVCGDSGSGKSELMNALALGVGDMGVAPIFLQARAFAGEFAPLLKKAIATATAKSPSELFASLGRAGREAILFVDGLNECPEARAAELLGALQAARLKFGFRLVTASQVTPPLPASLDGDAVALHQPDRAHAQRLVEVHLRHPLSADEEPGLEIVTTAHDCTVLSTVLKARANTDGRYALYAAFIRERGKDAPSAMQAALAQLAYDMRGAFVATLPVASAERFLAARIHDAPAVLRSGLAIDDGGLFRFRHELIADFYAADHLLRANRSEEALAEAACRPFNADLREFILGGCASTAGAEAVLDQVAATNGGRKLLIASLRGRCGTKVRSLLLDRCRDILEKVGRRFVQVHLAIPAGVETADKFHSFEMTFDADSALTKAEARLLNILPQAMAEGLLPEMLSVFGQVDRRLESEAARMRAEHPGFRLNWRAAAYGSIYGVSFSAEGQEMNNILSAMQMIRFDRQRSGLDLGLRHRLDDFASYTPGQLFLLVSAYRGAHDEPPPQRMNDLVRHLWGTRVYHLRLLAADIVRFHGDETPPEVQAALRETLDSWMSDNPWMNSIVVDAYPGVGGLEPQFTVEEAISEYDAILEQGAPEERASLALSAVIRTWDHPFAEVYWEAFYEGLPIGKRQALLVHALDVFDGDAMFLSDVVRALDEAPTPLAAPRLRAFAERPWEHNHGYQSALHLYANAIACLAKMGEPLGPVDTTGLPDIERAWREGAKLIYAFNTDRPVSDAEMITLWTDLAGCGPAPAIDVVMNLHREGNGYGHRARTAFLERCPSGLLELCRTVLAPDYEGRSIFRAFPNESHTDKHRGFALQLLGAIGRRSDLPLLRTWLDHPRLGEAALTAARSIEAR